MLLIKMRRDFENGWGEDYQFSNADLNFISSGFNGYDFHEDELFGLYDQMKEIKPHLDEKPYFALDKIHLLNQGVESLNNSAYFIHSNDDDKLRMHEILSDVKLTLEDYSKKAYHGIEFKDFHAFEELRGDFEAIDGTINIIKPHIETKPYFSRKVLVMANKDIEELLESPYCMYAEDRDDILSELAYLQCDVDSLMDRAYNKLEFEV